MASKKHLQKRIQIYFEEKEKGLDHQKMKKRAAELRRAEQKKSGSGRRKVRRGDWEDLIDGDAVAFDRKEPRGDSTQAWMNRLQAEEARAAGTGDGADVAGDHGLTEGTVAFVTAGRCDVELEDGTRVTCGIHGELRERQRSAVAIGDRALFEPLDEGGRLRRILPRRTSLSRPDPHDRRVERVIAANVDLVLVVAALREPRLSVGLIERVVLAVQRGGAEPVIVATKRDLCEDAAIAEALAALDPIREAGAEVFVCSAKSGEGIDAVRTRVRGATCALVGHSGVGKSSLLNALDPRFEILEGRVRSSDGKGRHTTTASALHQLEDGTRLIDTPGVREFGMWRMTTSELDAAFPEIEAAAASCRFRDCSHEHEPGCGVRAAIEVGDVSSARFRSYLRIKESL